MGKAYKQRNRVEAIKRRCDLLHERLAGWSGGDADRTRAELAALAWVLRLIEACEREGILEGLRDLGYDV